MTTCFGLYLSHEVKFTLEQALRLSEGVGAEV
jgi:hypothetical protein